MLFAAEEYITVKATMFKHFRHDGNEPEVVISSVVVIVFVLVLKESLRTKFKSL